jgi:hypothetical protein
VVAAPTVTAAMAASEKAKRFMDKKLLEWRTGRPGTDITLSRQ